MKQLVFLLITITAIAALTSFALDISKGPHLQAAESAVLRAQRILGEARQGVGAAGDGHRQRAEKLLGEARQEIAASIAGGLPNSP